MADDLHTATFTWPSTDAAEVLLTGTFDNWTKSLTLTKHDKGFTGSIQIPWGSEVQYKYVVDGEWKACLEQPVTLDGSNDNNVYTAPAKTAPAPDADTLVAAAAPGPTSVPESSAKAPEPVASHTEAAAPSPLPPTETDGSKLPTESDPVDESTAEPPTKPAEEPTTVLVTQPATEETADRH
ncbi:hypothetical protein BN14_01042 [Rhizoctonia solani AG-1 IB]|uniref:AMP-activated protein kinase glycogen-binding domain-containing protein n=1 Tax=Thanatephorus cucumeris (strain AG1-IB / isolate 7/3/14) TaxID=1108050 RepID=M5BJY8_THACB|nr:hypothetical protein BN14_01042 [Rhizoctonia solani AG-1 IB]